jgi:hypothetical protein
MGKCLFDSAILCVSSFFLMAAPSFFRSGNEFVSELDVHRTSFTLSKLLQESNTYQGRVVFQDELLEEPDSLHHRFGENELLREDWHS